MSGYDYKRRLDMQSFQPSIQDLHPYHPLPPSLLRAVRTAIRSRKTVQIQKEDLSFLLDYAGGLDDDGGNYFKHKGVMVVYRDMPPRIYAV